jgi:hypothetical protein
MHAAKAWIETHQTLSIIVGVVLFATVATAAMSEPTAAPQAGGSREVGQRTSDAELSAADATAQFKDLMDTSEKAELVSSYELGKSRLHLSDSVAGIPTSTWPTSRSMTWSRAYEDERAAIHVNLPSH